MILDTTVLIAAERAGAGIDEVIADEDDVAIAAITAAELLVGVQLADERRRAARRNYIDTLIEAIPVEPYDLEVARAHASLLAHVRKEGRPRGAHDLLIAATALARDRTVVTADPRAFLDLPQLRLRTLPANR